ncbi:helix-turn-helix domain-containing protein [Hazenella sp. IB182357]|uniref:Helix-turn-helix domain-containing protein n=1 Tax=Polycladospora coralii TaxID=2771432 RepID=A0A926NBH6_9BACL|nr:helix-turn-helix domain-containing protein [Polycladospora coralii]MBD1373522.1 helix-turn-helix domain-containing protein [Polycladospora coralii]MBS7531890.1 helix-turn-helix domain-containing protein [Polycladospora coralii]
MGIGAKIRLIRIHKKMTQQQFIEGICTHAYLSKVENEQVKPSKSFLKKLSSKLKLNLDDFFNEDKEAIVTSIRSISSEFRSDLTISENELLLLKLYAKDFFASELYLKIYSTLIKYYVTEEVTIAKHLYHDSIKYILEDDINNEDDMDMDRYYYYFACGNLFHAVQDFAIADEYFSKAERLSDNCSIEEMGKLYFNISIVKMKVADHPEVALEYVNKSYALLKKIGGDAYLTKVLILKSIQLTNLNAVDEALTYLEKARQLVCSKDLLINAVIAFHMGNIYKKKNYIDVAVDWYKKNIQLNIENKKEELAITGYQQLAKAYYDIKRWDIANDYLECALRISETRELRYNWVETKRIQIELYKRFDIKKYELALKEVIEYCKVHNQTSFIYDLASELGKYYFSNRYYKKSAEMLLLALESKDTGRTEEIDSDLGVIP